ncbi:TolC family protein [Poriferisphaera sp. WC338]|uniref:TolC family protein n=1 Tax=Poriferisphaera sp. WC338 TaxID=3425129 RepID=UPI003D81527E
MSTESELSLRDALAATLLHHPQLQASAWGPRIEEARRLQAGLLPNPEVGVEFENFVGSGGSNGVDALETTIFVTQLIELGNKRNLRAKVPEGARKVSELKYKSQRLEVITETARRFIRVLKLQSSMSNAEQVWTLAEESRLLISQRVEAGEVSPIDEIKARLESDSARIAADRLKRELVAARRELCAMWDEDEPAFDVALGSLDDLLPVPPFDELASLVASHPKVKQWAVERERRAAVVKMKQAQSIPNLRAGLGVRYANEIDEASLVGGVSMDIPLFDRSQGSTLAARLFAAQAQDEVRALKRELSTQLAREHGRASIAYNEVYAIDATLLPAANEAYEAARLAYQEGHISYLGVLDAQRALFDIISQRLETLAEYHTALIQVEGIIAEPLSVLTTDVPYLTPTTGDQP